MTYYKPRVYIRDYGTPTKRLLAFKGSFQYTGYNILLKRNLVLRADAASATEERLLLSGDAQFGTDVLKISSDSVLLLASGRQYKMNFVDFNLFLHRVFRADTNVFALTGNALGMKRQLKMSVTSGSYTLTGYPLTFTRRLLLSGDMQAGGEILLLSGDEATGGLTV
jgi:hypothetical protein